MKAPESFLLLHFNIVMYQRWQIKFIIGYQSCSAVYYSTIVVLTFESVDENLKCEHSNESY